MITNYRVLPTTMGPGRNSVILPETPRLAYDAGLAWHVSSEYRHHT
jgi:hypothetical protein